MTWSCAAPMLRNHPKSGIFRIFFTTGRALPESTASSSKVKPYAWNAGARAIEDHLARNGVKGQVTRALTMFYQVSYDAPDRMAQGQRRHAVRL